MNKKMINFNGNSHKMNEFNKLNNFNQKQNIMKKSILLLAVAASFAACTQNEEINDAISQQEIKFDQVLNKTTKAEITNKAALAEEGGFAVYGKKTPNGGSGAYWVFDGTAVTSTDGDSWGYIGTQYWDKVATYNFYAAAPAEGNIAFDKSTGMFTFSNVTWGTSTGIENDYLVDRNGATVNAATADLSKAVGFEFHHVMAKVDFKVATTIAGVTIDKLVMKGWNNNPGTFVQTATSTPESLEHSEWSFDTYDAGGNVTVSATSIEIEKGAAAIDYGETYIMVPQTLAALQFVVDYKIGSEPFVNQPVTLESIWGTDSHVTYTLNIGGGANPISFTVSSVCGFDVKDNDNNVEVVEP